MKEKDKRFYILTLLFVSVICVMAGISIATFNYFGSGTTNNVIQTGKIIFSYSDANGGGNGIDIKDASPIPDDVGKRLSSDSEYFDFNVSATTTNSNLTYEIAVEKTEDSTLEDEYIKIYLTALNGNIEEETPLTIKDNEVITYDMLNDTTNPLLTGKTIYYGTVKAGEVSYMKKFNLRMWVKDITDDSFDYTQLYNKVFKLKVNVAANSIY